MIVPTKKMGNKINKSNIDPELIRIVNDNHLSKDILNGNKKYDFGRFYFKNLNLLQRLIYYLPIILIKNYLIDNIEKYKNEINYRNDKGWTALMLGCRWSYMECYDGIVKLLLENGADPNLKDNIGWTALMKACRYANTDSNIETVKLLLEFGAYPNLKDNNGWTALMLACTYANTDSNIETVKLLLENGADINLKNNDGFTALMLACVTSNIETIKLLLNQNNIDVNITTTDKNYRLYDKHYNALMLLCKYNKNQHEIATLLKSKTNLDHRTYWDEKIEDICLPEYKKIFIRNWVSIINDYDTIKSECIICAKENIKCIICKHEHTTCYECLDRLKFKCEGCQLVL